MIVIAIDPGPEHSAYVLYDTVARRLVEFGKIHNGDLLARIRAAARPSSSWGSVTHVAIEMIASYGMPVGREVFDTCVMIGRIVEAWVLEHTLVYRREVKLALCGSARAKDANVRQSLIDRYGGKPATKKGGVLYGVVKDCWSALGVAVTWSETQREMRGAA